MVAGVPDRIVREMLKQFKVDIGRFLCGRSAYQTPTNPFATELLTTPRSFVIVSAAA
jgi:hypothetical protein